MGADARLNQQRRSWKEGFCASCLGRKLLLIVAEHVTISSVTRLLKHPSKARKTLAEIHLPWGLCLRTLVGQHSFFVQD